MQKIDNQKYSVLVVVAVAMTVKVFLLNYLRALSKDCDVTVVCSGDASTLADVLPEGVKYVSINIQRNISPLGDLMSLFSLIRFLKSQHFDMIHSVTPKAGLLAQFAAWISGISIRVHTFTGQVWATKQGMSRFFLKMLDRVIALCTTRALADSASQREFLITEKVISADKIEVLGQGSISGVDVQRFQPNPEVRQAVRKQLGFSDEDVLALFVGRLNRDKGVLDLIRAFAQISQRMSSLKLLLVGPDEADIASEINRLSGNNMDIKILGSTSRPHDYMASADFLCLPSYREGFGSVVIEAAACGLPAMASSIYGLTDAVDDGKSGMLHAPKDVEAISQLMQKFTVDATWRQQLGQHARQRAIQHFSAETIIEAQMCFVHGLLGGRNG